MKWLQGTYPLLFSIVVAGLVGLAETDSHELQVKFGEIEISTKTLAGLILVAGVVASVANNANAIWHLFNNGRHAGDSNEAHDVKTGESLEEPSRNVEGLTDAIAVSTNASQRHAEFLHNETSESLSELKSTLLEVREQLKDRDAERRDAMKLAFSAVLWEKMAMLIQSADSICGELRREDHKKKYRKKLFAEVQRFTRTLDLVLGFQWFESAAKAFDGVIHDKRKAVRQAFERLDAELMILKPIVEKRAEEVDESHLVEPFKRIEDHLRTLVDTLRRLNGDCRQEIDGHSSASRSQHDKNDSVVLSTGKNG